MAWPVSQFSLPISSREKREPICPHKLIITLNLELTMNYKFSTSWCIYIFFENWPIKAAHLNTKLPINFFGCRSRRYFNLMALFAHTSSTYADGVDNSLA